MSLGKKYSIPAETIKNMVNDGVISCSIARQYEIYDYLQEFARSSQATGKSKAQIFIEVSEKMRCSESWVRTIYYELSTK